MGSQKEKTMAKSKVSHTKEPGMISRKRRRRCSDRVSSIAA